MGILGRGGGKETSNNMLLSFMNVLMKTPPTRDCRGWEKMWWGYTGDAYFCVNTQQCATNVIFNPELHVLGIV